MLFEVLRLVGMKHGTGIGTGTRMGYGAGVEYIATGVGVYIGTGHGSSILLGSQFSSTNKDAFLYRLYKHCKPFITTNLHEHYYITGWVRE